MKFIPLDQIRGHEFIRNKGGFTSRVKDMGVQWECYPNNCGKTKYRRPIVALHYDRDDFPPSFEPMCEDRNHSYLIGSLGSVCKYCGLYVEHGMECPVTGKPTWMVDSGWSEVDLEKTQIAVIEFLSKSNEPLVLQVIRKNIGIEHYVYTQAAIRTLVEEGAITELLGSSPSCPHWYALKSMAEAKGWTRWW